MKWTDFKGKYVKWICFQALHKYIPHSWCTENIIFFRQKKTIILTSKGDMCENSVLFSAIFCGKTALNMFVGFSHIGYSVHGNLVYFQNVSHQKRASALLSSISTNIRPCGPHVGAPNFRKISHPPPSPTHHHPLGQTLCTVWFKISAWGMQTAELQSALVGTSVLWQYSSSQYCRQEHCSSKSPLN